jgi:hypothetical protein
MEGSVEHRYFGTRLVRVDSLGQIAYGKKKSKLRSLERISKRHSHVRRVMLILGEERWFWKSVIMHISECRLFVAYGGLMSEGSYHLGSRKGEVAYQLELPAQLSRVHDVFHASELKKCTSEVKIEPVQLEDIQMENDLTYKEYPVRILDTSERVTRSKIIMMCKVQWSHHAEEEATWEREDELKEDFPQLFSKSSESRDEILFKGLGFVTP